jgi:lysyl-tRNA synthetase class 2
LILERREKLKAIRQRQAEGHGVAFPNDFKPTHKAEALFAEYDPHSTEILTSMAVSAKVAGRMMLKRVMGKASFCTLQDASFGPSGGRIQIYVKGEDVGAELYALFKHWDLGDIVAAEGTVFKTKTGELSIHATSLRLLTKSLRHARQVSRHERSGGEVPSALCGFDDRRERAQALCGAQQGGQWHSRVHGGAQLPRS